jgi:DNA-binding beta-propeller fold protein YncE
VADAATVYVLDKNGIACFDKQGGSKGVKATGLFKDPKGLYMEGNLLYVADFGNGQVQILEKGTFNVARVIKDQLVSPWGVCTDVGGHVYVADPGAMAVFHYDGNGAFVERIDPITIKGFISPRAVLVRGETIYVGDFDRILGFKKGVLTIRPTMTIGAFGVERLKQQEK